MAQTQKALHLTSKQGSLELASGQPIPKPGPGLVSVKIHATALNPIDWKVQKLGFFVDWFPSVLGTDIAGEVVEVGENVDGWKQGDRIFFQGSWVPDNSRAGFQQYTLADPQFAAHIPANVAYEQAASFPVVLGASIVGLYAPSPAGAGLTPPFVEGGRGKYKDQPLVVLGGASSVGQIVIQLAKLSGFSPIITTASAKHESHLKSLGATHVIDRNVPLSELASTVGSITSTPVKLVFDAVTSAETQNAGYNLLAEGGQFVVTMSRVNLVEKPVPGKEIISVLGLFGVPSNREVGKQLYASLEQLVGKGELKPNTVEVLPGGLNAVVGGLQRLQKGQVSGQKLVVRPQETDYFLFHRDAVSATELLSLELGLYGTQPKKGNRSSTTAKTPTGSPVVASGQASVRSSNIMETNQPSVKQPRVETSAIQPSTSTSEAPNSCKRPREEDPAPVQSSSNSSANKPSLPKRSRVELEEHAAAGFQDAPSSDVLPSLNKNQFEEAFGTYAGKQGLMYELGLTRLLNLGDQYIDLHALHVNVMREGGGDKVHDRDLWGVIGGRMGFVIFPGTNTQPAKSGPGIAQRLAQVYKEYLGPFDQFCIESLIEIRKREQVVKAGSDLPSDSLGDNDKRPREDDTERLRGDYAQGTLYDPLPPPLDRARFQASYKDYITKQGVKHEMRLMSLEGRTIDLYPLHVNVMQEGGHIKVHNKELWPVIGARMGYASIPASATEPAKASPNVAQRLAQAYKEYLSGFDQMYINAVIESRRKKNCA